MSQFNKIFEIYENAKNEAKKEMLCSLLEEIGFAGIDVSIEESLFVYGLVSYNDYYIAQLNSGFEIFTMCRGSIEEALRYIKIDEFCNYIGTEKDEYYKLLDDESNYHQMVSDIYGYDNTVLINDYFYYQMDINDIINYLKSNHIK